MKFHFQNIGSIKDAQFELGDLNIVCGKNNTGKTYLTYTLWQILSKTFEMISTWEGEDWPHTNPSKSLEIISEKNILEAWDRLSKAHTAMLYKTFSSSKSYFDKSAISIVEEPETGYFDYYYDDFRASGETYISHDSTIAHLYRGYFNGENGYGNLPFLLTAQRDSIELFYKEIDRNRSNLVNEAIKQGDMRVLEKQVSRFPLPIQENIDFARDLTSQVIKDTSFLAEEHPELLFEIEEMLGVKYLADEMQITVRDATTGIQIPSFMASTSVRSLLHLHFWLKHKAQRGNLLMIDEPELNLHPENQIKIARLFAKLVNLGIRVWITTHSDYIIKELNNCLMLSQDFDGKPQMMDDFGYKEMDILSKEQVKAYMTVYNSDIEGNVMQPAEFDEYGMMMLTFDEQIERINEISNELSNAIYAKSKVKG